MMIKEVKKFLKEKKRADLITISGTLRIDKVMAKHALQMLMQKGLVKEEKIEMSCKTCNCGGVCVDTTFYIYKE